MTIDTTPGATTRLEARLPAAKPVDDGDLTWLPAWRLREMIGSKQISPVEVVKHFLDRIAELDPQLHAFRWFYPDDALDQAKAAEAAVMAGEELGPLHGVPVAFKDHYMIGGRVFLNLREAPALTEPVADRDCIEVTRMRKAGAIIFGHTWMGQEFSNNPWDLSRVPGVSSGGNGPAVAAGLVPIALGSDAGGSVRLPAALSGTFGIIPTRGRVPDVSWRSLAPWGHMRIGPATRDVRDAAIALAALAGPSGYDHYALQDPAPDFLGSIGKGIGGIRLAWTDDFGHTGRYSAYDTPGLIEKVRAAAFALEQVGAAVSQTREVWDYTDQEFLSFMLSTGAPAPVEAHPSAKLFEASLERRNELWTKFMRLFETHDLLLSPTLRLIAPPRPRWNAYVSGNDADTAERPMPEMAMSKFGEAVTAHMRLFNWMGFPAANVPVGFIDGMPIGLQIAGPPNSEPKILQLAQAVLEMQAQ